MEAIKVNHETYVQLKLGSAIWWERIENTPKGRIGGIVEVQYWPNDTDCHTFECKIMQIVRTVNSNRYVYRLVTNK